MSNQGEKKGVSAIDFFCIGFGAIVGVGWAVSINNWMSGSGGPIPAGLGYIAALIMMVPSRCATANWFPPCPSPAAAWHSHSVRLMTRSP